MLRGVYSQLNNFGKLILLTILLLGFLLISALLGILVLVPFYGTDVINLLSTPDYSDPSVVNALKVIQVLNMTGGLLLPTVIYLWISTPSNETFIRLNKPFNTAPLFLAVALIIVAQPLIGWTSELNSRLNLPEWLASLEQWMKSTEKQGELITEAFLSTNSIAGFLFNIFMIAILPAFAEEFLFRGALAGLFKTWTKSTHLAVFLSSVIFAAIHLQFYGFLPRFLLGMGLGYLYFWSGSLWLPITAHFANNFLSVGVEFLYRKGLFPTNAEEFGMNSAAWLTMVSIVSIVLILFYIRKLSHSAAPH